MPDMEQQNSFYRNSVSPGRRKSLLAAYKEYCYLISSLEAIIREYHLRNVSLSGLDVLNKDEEDPWEVREIDEKSQEEYEQFLEHMQVSEDEHTCYVSLNHTSPRYKDEPHGIVSAPDNFSLLVGTKPLPQKVERYVLAYPKGELMKDARFIIGGKHIFSYDGIYNDKTVEEAFNDEIFEQRFNCILEIFAQFPDDTKDLSEQERISIEKEVAASFKLAPLENAILDALSLVADESNKILKDIIGRRVGGSYLSQAEKEGLLPSAAGLQDYLHIRHLLRHQWDTLDGIGKFNENELLKNASVRRRYLDSYAKLCDKPIKERIAAYHKTAEDFIPLMTILNPEFLARDNIESNNKFMKRLRDKVNQDANATYIIKTGYDSVEKKDSLIRNLQNISPNIEVIDRADATDINRIDDLMNNYLRRRVYIDVYQQMENRICQFCLFEGKNYAPIVAWDNFRRRHLISVEEANQWAEYKKLRNDLSHRHMDEELNAKVNEILPQMSEDSYRLNARLDERMPILELIGENIYRAHHPNGMVVDIDYPLKKVLKIVHNNGYVQQRTETDKENIIKRKPYTEEHKNGINITISGLEITSCHLNNGIDINFKKKYIAAEDGVKLYFDNPQKLFMTAQSGEKIFADNKFEVLKYICRGKVVNLGRKENLTFQNSRRIYIGADGRLQEESWINGKGKRMQGSYQKSDSGLVVEYDDKTKIVLMGDKAKVFHNDVELTYLNRKAFAESYDLPITINTKNNGR